MKNNNNKIGYEPVEPCDVSPHTEMHDHFERSADQLLLKASALINDRGRERDCTDGERSMARAVHSFNQMFETELTTEQGWAFMVFLKIARMQYGAFNPDDYEDAIAYVALMAEEALG